jgi:3',5'-nucleoside bisphosphate phosphatase
MPGIDLHAHSTRSDGTLTPAEVVRLARERELAGVALTDHDATDGLDEARATAEELGIRFVPGVEFSATYEGSSIHVLGYWADPSHAEFAAELQRLREDRFLRGERMVGKLQALGYPISFERVQEIAGTGNIVRPHVARALVEAGVVPTEEDAYTEDLIADGGRADVQKHALHPLDALALIRSAGGACVIAHPGMWSGQRSVPEDLIEVMVEAGMAGLEADHPDHTPELRAHYHELAARLRVVATGASDFHGRPGEPITLGTVTTDPAAFERLEAAAGR